MSISASIKIHISRQVPTINILQILIKEGWSISHTNYTCYLPIGDNGKADWQAVENMHIAELSDILNAKEARNEMVGILLTWQNTLIGGNFLAWPDKQYKSFSISLDSDRQELFLNKNYSITNFQWYLEKTLPPLNEAFGVEYFSCEENR